MDIFQIELLDKQNLFLFGTNIARHLRNTGSSSTRVKLLYIVGLFYTYTSFIYLKHICVLLYRHLTTLYTSGVLKVIRYLCINHGDKSFFNLKSS